MKKLIIVLSFIVSAHMLQAIPQKPESKKTSNYIHVRLAKPSKKSYHKTNVIKKSNMHKSQIKQTPAELVLAEKINHIKLRENKLFAKMLSLAWLNQNIKR